MIILEGPDGAGKTRLAQRLSEELKLPLLPRAATSLGGPIEGVDNWVEAQLRMPSLPRGLQDRHPLFSEIIYGPIVRGWVAGKFNDPHWVQSMMTTLVSHRPIVVYCLPPMGVVRENILSEPDEQMLGVVANIDGIYSQYVTQLGWYLALKGRVMVWDYTSEWAESHFHSLIDGCKSEGEHG